MPSIQLHPALKYTTLNHQPAPFNHAHSADIDTHYATYRTWLTELAKHTCFQSGHDGVVANNLLQKAWFLYKDAFKAHVWKQSYSSKATLKETYDAAQQEFKEAKQQIRWVKRTSNQNRRSGNNPPCEQDVNTFIAGLQALRRRR